jgi:hypothetical protein
MPRDPKWSLNQDVQSLRDRYTVARFNFFHRRFQDAMKEKNKNEHPNEIILTFEEEYVEDNLGSLYPSPKPIVEIQQIPAAVDKSPGASIDQENGCYGCPTSNYSCRQAKTQGRKEGRVSSSIKQSA